MNRTLGRKRDSGFIMILAVGILLMITIMLLPLIQHFRVESTQTVKTTVANTGFMLAREAIYQGLWYVNLSSDTLSRIMSGQKMTGYKNDYNYNDNPVGVWYELHDSAQGTFTIDISSGPGTNQITIVGRGYPSGKTIAELVTAVYQDVSVDAAVYVESDSQVANWSVTNTFDVQGTPVADWSVPVLTTPQIHWGPIRCMRSMNVTNSPHFPRKYAKDNIVSLDNGSHRYNSDGKEYWANASDIDTPPLFDLGTMKSRAQGNGDYYGSSTYVGVSSMVTTSYLATSTTWFFQSNLEISGPVYYRGVIVVMGDLIIDATAAGANQAADMQNVPLPPNATAEYAAMGGTYPSDSGLRLDPSTTMMNFAPNTVGIRGFVYVNGNVIVNNVPSTNSFYIYGGLYAKGSMTVNPSANFRIYYGVSKASPPMGATAYAPWPAVSRPSWRKISWNESF